MDDKKKFETVRIEYKTKMIGLVTAVIVLLTTVLAPFFDIDLGCNKTNTSLDETKTKREIQSADETRTPDTSKPKEIVGRNERSYLPEVVNEKEMSQSHETDVDLGKNNLDSKLEFSKKDILDKRKRVSVYYHQYDKKLKFYEISVNGYFSYRDIDELGEKAILYLLPKDRVKIVFTDNSIKNLIFNGEKLVDDE
jgi:hypothetical protein